MEKEVFNGSMRAGIGDSRKKAIQRMYKLVCWLAGEMFKEEEAASKEEVEFKRICDAEPEKQHIMVSAHGDNARVYKHYMKEAVDAAEYLRDMGNKIGEWQIAGINAMCDRCNADKVIPFDLGVSVKGLLCMHVTSVPLLIGAVHIQTEQGGCDDRKEDGDMAKKRPMTTEELFNKINGILKEKGRLPDILDYGLATHRGVINVNIEMYKNSKIIMYNFSSFQF